MKTPAFALPVTLVVAWYLHVVNRAGNGPGFQWHRVPGNASFTALLTGVLYLVFVVVAVVVAYVTHVRRQPVSTTSVLAPVVLRLAAVYVIAVLVGAALGEWYCVADERAFQRETVEYLAHAPPNPVTPDPPLYSRPRWWPGNAQLLVSPTAASR
ncbi:MAG: hypothetical protein IPP90_09910 [Gemmatimonadaceae bacterium]|nr:hypothetical protein [Gemmatimonadaceae bacterium]